ncbi:putative ribonuclease H-like domain-containing protein [Tanacetum coccineum]|uniref:Ribonuclease H-like domain-containing protein n=1 Tax=Tanacetum coccineum TaxID=301880 RepID=A0ABQ5FYN9_9ASTR
MSGSQDEIPPPPPPPSSSQTPTQQTPHTVSTIKLPILKRGEYDIWALKMEHYLAHTDYLIWEVIQNGNGPVSITIDTQGQIKVLPPRTIEEILARERERKASVALPEDHLAKFYKMTNAKEMWDAIKSRFSRNDESKKMQKYILKQQFEGFSVSNSEGLHKGYDRFQSLLSQLEIHRAGVSTKDVNQKFLRSLPFAWYQVSLIMRTKPVVDSLSFDDLYNNLRVFENDVKGPAASSSSTQNMAFVSKDTSILMMKPVGFDKTNFECYNLPQDIATFSIECRTKGNQGKSRRMRCSRKLLSIRKEKNPLRLRHRGLKKVEAQLVAHQQGQLWYEEKIRFMKIDLDDKTDILTYHKNLLAEAQKEKEDLKAKVEKWHNSSKNLDYSQFTYGPNQSQPSESETQSSDLILVKQNECETHESFPEPTVNEPKVVNQPNVRSDAPIIEEYESDNEDEHVPQPTKEQEQPSFTSTNNMRMKSSQREIRPIWNNVQRVNHKNQFVPTAVLTRTGKIPVNTARASGTNKVNTTRASDYPHRTLKHKGLFDSCVQHMTGNKGYLAAYQRLINGGPVAFGGKFKNRDFIEFCGSKGIKREYSNARTPQQNGVAERKNRTLIEAARTMLADSFLPNTFWAEAVSTACYVLNRVLVTKPHNKTPYELVTGKIPIISYIRPFGCHVTILNTIDHLGKFDGKSDEGFLVGYSLQSKAFRVYNLETKRVEENLHITFLENKLNVVGKGPTWLFDLDYLTDSIIYQPVRSENQANKHAGPQEANHNAGTKDNIDAGDSKKEDESTQDYFILPIWSSYSSIVKRSTAKDADETPNKHLDLKTDEKPDAIDVAEALRKEFAQETEDLLLQAGAAKASSTNTVNTVSTPVSTASPYDGLSFPNLTYPDQDDSEIPALEDIYKNPTDGIFTNSSYDDKGAVADFTNLETILNVSPIPTSRINSIHPSTLTLGDPQSAVQTRSKVSKSSRAYAFVSYIQKQRRNNHKDFQHCLFACFLSQNEPKKISKALEDESWVDAIKEELLQFKIQKVWILVDLPYGKKEIRTKWVYRNKKDERGVVVRNKARIEAIRIFLAFASYMGFIVYQMDVKSAFLYSKINEEVYVSQPPGFIDPKYPQKVYKVVKALYGLHQAPTARYATLSTFLLKNGYRRGTINKTLFIKKDKHDIILVQVYVDDIIFGSTKTSWCDEFEALIKSRFQMSSMGELTFFLGLQTASIPIETQKPLVKDEEASDVDVHLYRSMIGSLMYLTTSRPDIMFVVCACSRFQVTPKTSHLSAVKRIFRYLKGKPKLGLWYLRVSSFDLEAYSDSDYARANLDRKSTTGGCQFLGRRLISWQCKKQTIVATSTTEAEYVAAANCCGQVLWIQNQMLDYGFNFMNTKIYIDNESIICIVKNPIYHSKTKHIAIRHHFIRDAYEKKLIQVLKIDTDDNVADLLTKAFYVSSKANVEPQSDPSPRPSPTPHIPDSILKVSNGNQGGQSSNDRSLSGTEGGMTLQCGRKSAKAEPSIHKDPLFDELDDDEIDNMDIEGVQDVGRTRNGVNAEKEGTEDAVSTKDAVSTDKQKVSTDRSKDSTDKKKDSTDKEKEGTDKEKDSTVSLDKGTDDRTEARSATSTTPTTTPTMFGDDETIAQVLLNMSKAKVVSREKEKGVELKDIDLKDKGKKKIKEEYEFDTESKDIPEAEKKFKQLARDEEMARKEREQFTVEERAKFLYDTIAAQRRFITEQRAIAIKNKPPIRTQLRNQMMTYLKHVGNKKHSDLKSKTFEEIQALYEKVKRFDESFTIVGSTRDERRIKEMNEGVKDTYQKRLKEEDIEKVPAKVEVTEQGSKKRKGGHIKMITRKKLRK